MLVGVEKKDLVLLEINKLRSFILNYVVELTSFSFERI